MVSESEIYCQGTLKTGFCQLIDSWPSVYHYFP